MRKKLILVIFFCMILINLISINIAENDSLLIINNSFGNFNASNFSNLTIEVNTAMNLTDYFDIGKNIIEGSDIKEEQVTPENIQEELIQYDAVLGEPVKWKKTIKSENTENIIVEIPEDAEEIVVYSIDKEKKIKETGEVDEENVFISGNSTEYEIEYETPAPYSIEEETSTGKIVEVVSPEDIHYEDVLVFTDLAEELNITDSSFVKIKWVEEDTFLNPTSVQDKNLNGVYDYVEWIAPHLSNQTFEIIIEVTKAEHLNENRNYISDIYEEVRELDGFWSESVNGGEYVRVIFENELERFNDITVYVRSEGESSIEVYTENGDELVSGIYNISGEGHYKTYLINLDNPTDIFDLKVIGDSVQFDYIVDPLFISWYNYTSDLMFSNITENSTFGARIDAPVLYMNFNNPPETLVDYSYINYSTTDYVRDNSIYNLRGDAGSLKDDGQWVDGHFSGGLEFDGTNDYVLMSDSLTPSERGYSVFTWIKYYDGISAGGGTVATSVVSNYILHISTITNKLYSLPINSTDYNSNGALTEGVWSHIGFTCDNTTTPANFTFYINGLPSGSFGISGCNKIVSPVYIGQYGQTFTFYLNSLLDELHAWKRPLNQTEVTELYTNNNVINSTDLIWQLHFNETSGKTAVNYANLSNNGTLINYRTSPTYNSSCTAYLGSGGCYEFDGVDDYINIENIVNIMPVNKNTFSFWLKSNTSSANMGIMRFSSIYNYNYIQYQLSGNSFALRTAVGNYALFMEGNASYYLDNEWHHFVFVINGSGISDIDNSRMYVDGNLYTPSTTIKTESPASFGAISLGTNFYGHFNGSIDDVTIWDRALSLEEIAALYSNTPNFGKYSKSGDFKSGVFYNSTPIYWNTTFSIANSSGRGINLSDSNLVSYWKFNGNYLDSKMLNNGTCTNCSNNATGLSSEAMRFDGVNDKISLTTLINLSTFSGWSLFAWINPKATTSQTGIFTGYLLNVESDNKLSSYDGTYKYSTRELTDGIWVHVGITCDNSTDILTYYINGVNDSSQSYNCDYYYLERMNAIGHSTSGSRFFNGLIDEVLIYNDTLTESEVINLYKAGLSQNAITNISIQTRTASNYNLTDPSLVSFWSFNLNESGNARDYKLMNNGSCYGATTCPTWNDGYGIVGAGYYFDGGVGGVNDSINLSNTDHSLNISNNWTISAWIYPYSLNGGTIYDNGALGGGVFLGLTSTSAIRVGEYSDSWTLINYSLENSSLDKWHHIAGTRQNGGNLSLYYDGVLVNSISSSGAITYTKLPTIGATWSSGSIYNNPFNGSIDEVRIYNRSLSSSEIQNLYELGSIHISDWSDWSSERIIYDREIDESNSFGKFFQFKALFKSNDTDVSPYLLNSSLVYGDIADITPPSITFEYPTPENNSVINTENITIIANISDNLMGNTSSWIDFDGSLLGYWSMDYFNSTHVFDNSSYKINASFNDGLNYSDLTPGARGQGLMFDGSSTYLKTRPFSLNSSLNQTTYSFWIKSTSSLGSKTILSDGNQGSYTGYLFFYRPSGSNYLSFQYANGTAFNTLVSGDIFSGYNNQWVFVTIIVDYNNGNVSFYRNSEYNSSVYSIGPMLSPITNREKYIGVYSSASRIFYFSGSLDEIMIFNRSLSLGEISSLYNSKINKFNSTINDLSSGQHNYIIYAMDEAGNLNNSVYRNFTIDLTYPTITFEKPPTPENGSLTNSVNITANISDNLIGNTSSWIDFDRSLVGYWAMDYLNSTHVFDNSSYSNSGLFKGNLSISNITSGARGRGLKFDGVSDYIQVSTLNNYPNEKSELTISAWVKYSSQINAAHVAGWWITNQNGLEVASNRIYVFFQNSTTKYSVSGSILNDSNWHHILATYNGTKLMLYQDGTLYSSTDLSGTLVNTNEAFSIGQYLNTLYTSHGNPFNGSIDEVMVFNRSLSQTEISALYNSKSNKFTSSFMNLEQGQHNYTVYAIDEAGNLNNSGKIDLIFDDVSPTVSIESPFPSTGPIKDSNLTFIVNISDSSTGNTSSWIDFDRSLVGYWAMDYYNTTCIFDNSSYDNNARFGYGLNINNLTDGSRGYGLKFDGVNDYLSIEDSSLYNFAEDVNFTISLWALKHGNGSNSYPGIFGHGAGDDEGTGYSFGLNGGDDLVFRIGNGTRRIDFTYSNAFSELDVWNYVAVTADRRGNALMYYNGEQVGSPLNISNHNVDLISTNTVLAAWLKDNSLFNGSLDEVMIFNRTLSQEEISALYNSKINKFNATFTNITQGRHNYTIYAIDEAGNLNNSITRSFIYDAVSPTIIFEEPITPENGSLTNNPSIIANISDNLIGNTSSWMDFDRSLIGYWSMDYSNLTHIFDNSSYKNNGTFAGSLNYTNLTAGARGYALNFDGGDYLSLSKINFSQKNFTISSWVKVSDTDGTYKTIFGKGIRPTSTNGEMSLSILEDNIYFLFRDQYNSYGYVAVSGVIAPNNWYNIILTNNGSMNSIYLNGIERNYLQRSSGSVYDGGGDNWIGTSGNASGSPSYFSMYGLIDEVMIFNRSLSQGEILALYNSVSNKFNATFSDLIQGEHDYVVYAVDEAGNINNSGERNLIFDNIAPLISFEEPPTPEDNSTISGNITITANISDISAGNTSSWIDFDGSLLGYWAMDYYNKTHIFDNSSYGNNAAFSGGLNYTNLTYASRGYGLKFDGVNDKITTKAFSLQSSLNQLTYSFWINSTSGSSQAIIADGSQSSSVGYVWIQRQAFGDLLAFHYANGTSFIPIIFGNVFTGYDNQWILITITADYTNRNVTIYRNGEYISSTYRSDPMLFPSANRAKHIGSYSTSYYFSGSLDEVMIFNRSLSLGEIYLLYNSQVNKFNATFTNLSEGYHNYTVYAIDEAGNLNNSGERSFYFTFLPPEISNVVYYSDSQADIDPGVNITFNATVISERSTVDTVILQYYESDSDTWYNSTMFNISENLYQTSIILNSSESNYTFNVWANDSIENSNHSLNQTFESAWDCTWNLSVSSLAEISGFYENKFLGNFTIFNTGDSNYSGGCLIKFAPNYISNTFSGNYYTSNFPSSTRISFNSSSVSLLAGESSNIEVTGGFPDSDIVLQEHPILNITSNLTDTIEGVFNRYINATMIVVSGASLYEEIFEPSGSLVNIELTNQLINWSAFVRNLGGDDTDNNTAYNVSFNWTLPSSLSDKVTSGNLTSFYENLSNFDRAYNNLTLEFTKSNLESNAPQINTPIRVYIYSYGYENTTGNLSFILDSNNDSLLVDYFDVTFLCKSEPDGITISSCGSSDGDYVAPVTSNIVGGSGGGGSSGNLYEKSESTIELVRGEEQEFKLKIENKLSLPKEDVVITVSGINSEYIQLIPSEIDRIEPKSFAEITIKISSPKYFNYGKYLLSFKIHGNVLSNSTSYPFTEERYLTLYIVELNRDSAINLINNSEGMFSEMINNGLKTQDLNVLLREMNSSLEDRDYGYLKTKYEELKDIYESALESKEIMEELNESIGRAVKKGISVTETQKLIFIAEAAFERGDYLLALERLKEAKLSYALEVKGEFNIWYTIKNNPFEALGIFIGISFFGFGTSLVTRRALYKKKLKLLNEEELLLLELMKVVQRDCFEKKKMSMEEYQQAMNQYENKLGETIQDKIRFETKLANLIKVKGKRHALDEEREKLVDIMKKTQVKYLKESKLDTRIYDNMMKSYASRLSEIEEKLVFLEAKENLRNKNIFRRVFK